MKVLNDKYEWVRKGKTFHVRRKSADPLEGKAICGMEPGPAGFHAGFASTGSKMDKSLLLICQKCGNKIPLLGLHSRIWQRIQEMDSDARAALRDSGERVTNAAMREFAADVLGDDFFNESWSKETLKEFDSMVKELVSFAYPGPERRKK